MYYFLGDTIENHSIPKIIIIISTAPERKYTWDNFFSGMQDIRYYHKKNKIRMQDKKAIILNNISIVSPVQQYTCPLRKMLRVLSSAQQVYWHYSQ